MEDKNMAHFFREAISDKLQKKENER